uniref:AfsR/SARP family transcriptional regulator n=1 Tax=Haloactinopolyspora sp. TaxID=1966353 RepID=UPI00260DAE4A
LAVGTGAVLPAAAAREHPAPFPGLVTLGHDTEDGLLLVDLEHLRSLAVTGPEALTQALMTAVAAEFATSPWADDIRVTLVGERAWSELEVLETGRIRRVTDVDRLLDELAVRAADDRGLLASAGMSDLAAARAAQAAEAAWTPEILLLAEPLTDERHTRLVALLEHEPRVAIAALIGGGSGEARWRLRMTGSGGEATAVLDPLGMTLRPQLLDAASCGHVLNLVRSSDEVVGQAVPEPDMRAWPVHPVGPSAPAEPAEPAEPVEPAEPTAPRLIMLGPVEVIHTAELGERNKLGQLTELAMFIALNPGCDSQAIDDAIWPGSIVTRTTRNTAISKLRRWLGTDARGAPLLPRTEGRYAFQPDVRSDWDDWCDLLPQGPQNATSDDLRAAVALVKGRPFSGRGRRSYAWVDHHAQDMIAAIVDACHELAVRSSSGGDHREALRVALLGLSIEPGVELLWRDRLKAEVMLGDRETVLQSIDRLRSTTDELGGDLDPGTEELIEQILHHGGRVSAAG